MGFEQEQHDTHAGVSRRAAMKLALKTGAYAAPAVLSVSGVASRVAAATPPPPPPPPPATLCAAGAASLAFPQDALLLNVAPGAPFDVFAQPNTAAAPTMVGSFTADALGVAVATFALPPPAIALNTTSVTLSVFLAGSTTPSATFVSGLVGLIACTAGGPRQAAQLTTKVIQEATGCPGGNPNQWREIVDANLVNAVPNAPYDIYFRPNNVVGGAFALAGTITTNAQGNAGAILTAPVIATTGGNPTSVVVTAVAGGSAAPTAASALTATATPTGNPATSSLFTVTCAGTVSASLSVAAANKAVLLTGVA